MTSVTGMTSGALARAVVCPVPVRWRLAVRAVCLQRCVHACCTLPMATCHGLTGGGGPEQERGVPKQSP
jgi:hypothetical protein